MNKASSRLRRGLKTKIMIKQSGKPRLVVFRSLSHIYAQITVPGPSGDTVLVSASTKDKDAQTLLSGKKIEQAVAIGKLIATKAINKSITEVAFDRSGYKYHGRVKALADGAREAGLIF